MREVKKDGSADARDARFGVCFAKIHSTVQYTALRNATPAANQKLSTFPAQHVYRHVILYWEQLTTKSCVSEDTNTTFPLHCSLIITTSSVTHSELPNSSLDKTHAYTG